jgi:alpha-ketoglutarate-dependent taurine dioxygenase
MFEIIPGRKEIGAQIICNLKRIKKNHIKKIKYALQKYGMIYFRNQNLSSSNYLKFAKKLGVPADYPRLKGLSSKFTKITVVERKSKDKGPSFGEQFHTDSIYTKKPPRFTMLLSKLVPRKGQANTEFSSQYLAYENLPHHIKKKLKNLKAIYSSEGPISITTKERAKEKGKEKNELISKHKIIKKINRKLSIFCSPGHFIGFNNLNKKKETKLKNFLFKHQIKKKFQCSLEWEKNQLAIWDNRSMLHQATPFRGNRIMHRITIY